MSGAASGSVSGSGASGGGALAAHPFYAAAAATPELVAWWDASFTPTVFAAGQAPARVKMLLRLRLEALHGVRYPGLGDPAAAGVTTVEAAAIGGPLESVPVSAAERAVLALGDEMALVNMEGYLSDELYGRLAAHYSDGAIFELGQTMAILVGFAKFLRVWGIPGLTPGAAPVAPGA